MFTLYNPPSVLERIFVKIVLFLRVIKLEHMYRFIARDNAEYSITNVNSLFN